MDTLKDIQEDRTWELVLETLSARGRLARLYKLPRHELNALLKGFSASAFEDLRKVFLLSQTHQGRLESYLEDLGEARIFAMLHNLIRCMKCWVESESAVHTVRRRWKVANS